MQIDSKSFIALMKRASRCKYDTVILNNHMLMQCYSVGDDADIGFHYILAIPKTGVYDTPFYDMLMILKPSSILKIYNDTRKVVDDERKAKKLKPKDLVEELYVRETDGNMEFKFVFILDNQIHSTAVYTTAYPIDKASSKEYANCVEAYNKLTDWIKIGGMCVVFDAKQLSIVRLAYDHPSIYFYTIRYQKRKIRIPFAKSMFLGTAKWDTVMVSVQDTNLDDIYIYTLQLTKAGLTEYRFGYIQNF